MTTNNDDIGVLNHLIEVTIDSADGYREAAEDVRSPELRTLFQQRSTERLAAFAALQAQVTALGGLPQEEGTLLGSMHRVFVNFRNAIDSGNVAVIEEVERGEDHITSRYEEAIKGGKLSASSLSVVQKAYQSVRSGHDQMSQLKHSMLTLRG